MLPGGLWLNMLPTLAQGQAVDVLGCRYATGPELAVRGLVLLPGGAACLPLVKLLDTATGRVPLLGTLVLLPVGTTAA